MSGTRDGRGRSAGEAAGSAIASYLASQSIPHARVGTEVFSLQLAGERKLTIPVTLVVRERTLVVESFFMRRPIENETETFGLLLRRNLRARFVHFALDDRGDIHIVGQVPVTELDEERIDELLGEIVTTADEMFDAAIARGFATYLANDLAWRGRQTPPQ